MTPPAFRIAVIADAHLHDMHADFGQGAGPVLRPASDVVKSTRVFNETGPVLRHVLRDIAARGIRHVVLLGDLTDDGQPAMLDALQRILDEARPWGLTFWAVPGNHDLFADTGRHRTRRMVNAAGDHDLFTSDPGRHDPTAQRVVVTPRMRCPGQPEGLLPRAGFFGNPVGLHWETPFGRDPAPETRQYPIRSDDGTVERHLMDASYLAEPAPGVWLLMIDANVWVPFGRNRPVGEGDFADATEAGWPAMLRHKAFVVAWMREVAVRAREQGKRLLTFSHYPVIDPFADSRAAEDALLGQTMMARRSPGSAVARALAETGIGVHFSGHLHLNATARYAGPEGWLVDVAVPSLAAFPAAFKIVTIGDTVQVQTDGAGDMPMPAGVAYPGVLAGHDSYGGFLAAHARHLVGRRFLRREWPADLAAAVPGRTLADMGVAGGEGIAALTVIEDWHLLRMGGPFGCDLIPPDRLALYRGAVGCTAPWVPLLAMIQSYLGQLPARDFRIDPVTGDVSEN
jgi:3',5'-cyclic AMP phosphodiesterase CpdA